jgi:8-oxo-dGTP diphosphatase
LTAAVGGAGDGLLEVVVGLLRDDRGRVLVSQRRSDTPMAGWWEFPGGKRRCRETSWNALARELEEELGIRALGGTRALDYCYAYPDKRVHLEVWWVADYTGEPQGREAQRLEWLEPRELAALKLLAADWPIVEALLAAAP